MNFVGSESDWCQVYDPEEERHDALFNGYDLQYPWNEAENGELKDDNSIKKNEAVQVRNAFILYHSYAILNCFR